MLKNSTYEKVFGKKKALEIKYRISKNTKIGMRPYIIERKIINCSWCQKPIKIRIKDKRRKCCCKKCSYNYLHSLVYDNTHIYKKCIYCKKEYWVTKSNDTFLCSKPCQYQYLKENKLGIYSDKSHFNSIKTRRINKIGWFNSEVQSRGGKLGGLLGGKNSMKVQRKLKINFFNKKWHKKHNEYMKKNKFGFYNIELARANGIKAVKTNKKNKTGWFNSEVQSRGGKEGIKTLRQNKNIKFNKLLFDSKSELEFGLNIHYQIEKLKYNRNFQIPIKNKTFDFFITQYNIFIEYHPIIKNLYNHTTKEYYYNRRKILNNNGYKQSQLLVIE